ncbi:hypothetical protein M8J77_005002 [Diaphorina citri]|nr:hypothetical protein M8J77_005002 [Diaphorina citri]
MDNTHFKFINNKRVLLYNGHSYNSSLLQKDKTYIYKCIVNACSAKIKFNQKRTEILEDHLCAHTNHSAKSSPSITTHQGSTNIASPRTQTTHSRQRKKKGNASVSENLTPQVVTRSRAVTFNLTNIDTNHSRTSDVTNIKSNNTTSAALIDNESNLTSPTYNYDSPGSCVNHETRKLDRTALSREVYIQTDIDAIIWSNMRDGLIDKISEQMKEIGSLKQTIVSLESRIKQLDMEHANLPRTNMASIVNHDISRVPIKNGHCFVIGDSHVRGLAQELLSISTRNIKVESFLQPGAGFSRLSQIITKSPNLIQAKADDMIVICCGTNDVCKTDWVTIKDSIDSVIENFKQCSRLCFIGVPLRCDNWRLNRHIINFNTKIKNYIKTRGSTFLFIDCTKFLKPYHYRNDGIHLNKPGKQLLCRRIKNTMFRHISHSNNHKLPSDFIPADNNNLDPDVSLNSTFGNIRLRSKSIPTTSSPYNLSVNLTDTESIPSPNHLHSNVSVYCTPKPQRNLFGSPKPTPDSRVNSFDETTANNMLSDREVYPIPITNSYRYNICNKMSNFPSDKSTPIT